MTVFAQTDHSNIVGKWQIVDVQNKALLTHCGSPVDHDEIEANIEKEFCDASIEFLSTQQILYRDKDNKLHGEKDCLHFLGIQEFKWVLENNKLKLRHSDEGRRIRADYHEGHITLNFLGIIFTLEKINQTSISANYFQLGKP